MIDETLRELVSRSLDGDLEDAEASHLEECAQSDAAVRAEIDSDRQLRAAVAALAERMEPPASLDKVMDPLRRSAPVPPQRIRPAFRWLGAAAAVVLGVTVTVEMARRNPEPSLGRPAEPRGRSVHERGEIFQLAPLPTANPDAHRPIGATERLLEEEPVAPGAPEPAALEVMGPLRTTEPAVEADPVRPPISDSSTRNDVPVEEMTTPLQSAETEKAVVARAAEPPVAGSEAALRSRDRGHEATARDLDTGKAHRGITGGDRDLPSVSVVLRVDNAEVWFGSATGRSCGTWWMRIDVVDGEVVSLESIPDGSGNETDEGCQPLALIGSVLAGVADGNHLAEFTAAGDRQ